MGLEFQGVEMSHSTAFINGFFINHLNFEMSEFKQFKTVLQNTVKLCPISHGMVHTLLWPFQECHLVFLLTLTIESNFPCIRSSRST